MSEFLHLAAVAPAGVAACCAVSGRRRGRAVEVVVAVLMLAAMIDASRSAPLFAPVLWAALLLTGALALAAATRRRPAVGAAAMPAGSAAFHGPLHGALGCIAMAALVLLMAAPAPASAAAADHGALGHHGASASVLTIVIGAGVLAYGAYSMVALRHGGLRERVQYAAMGASTLGMAAAVLL